MWIVSSSTFDPREYQDSVNRLQNKVQQLDDIIEQVYNLSDRIEVDISSKQISGFNDLADLADELKLQYHRACCSKIVLDIGYDGQTMTTEYDGILPNVVRLSHDGIDKQTIDTSKYLSVEEVTGGEIICTIQRERYVQKFGHSNI